MVRFGKRRISGRKFALVLIDLALVVFALHGALFLHEPDRLTRVLAMTDEYIFMYLSVSFLTFLACGFYSHIWRFASIAQYAQLLLGVTLQTAICWTIMLVGHVAFEFPAYLIYMMLLSFGVVGVRILYRIAMNNATIRDLFYHSLPQAGHSPLAGSAPQRRRMLVIGAGVTGSQLIREMMQNPDLYEPVALIDDNPLTHTYKVLGVPVVGGREEIPETVRHLAIDGIILAIPSAPRQTVREFVEICRKTGVELKMVPLLADLIDGRVSITSVKNVDIDDLLGRDEVVLNTASISGYLEGETVLVTGGGGSIGSELCRQIARFKPKRLIVFDVYENNAYQLQYELKGLYGDALDLVVLIGSVRDELRLTRVFAQYKPGVVFHAAAHKHVPLMEDSPGEAVKNNILGTLNTARVAAQAGVKRFVLISTDKAVNPTNVMGATKRFAELVVQTLAAQYPMTRFAAVRFGNVLGSNGSVIPLFKQQIANERRVTVTHPDITRYFMTIPEASRLVIQAGALAARGDIFVLDMGEPVRIDDLARDLIRLSGLEPGVDVEIVYTGLRPGEKMYEELFQDKESMTKSAHDMIFALKPIQDVTALTREIAVLKRIIPWDNDEFQQVRAWIEARFQPPAAAHPASAAAPAAAHPASAPAPAAAPATTHITTSVPAATPATAATAAYAAAPHAPHAAAPAPAPVLSALLAPDRPDHAAVTETLKGRC